jgi:hypothetical protein
MDRRRRIAMTVAAVSLAAGAVLVVVRTSRSVDHDLLDDNAVDLTETTTPPPVIARGFGLVR